MPRDPRIASEKQPTNVQMWDVRRLEDLLSPFRHGVARKWQTSPFRRSCFSPCGRLKKGRERVLRRSRSSNGTDNTTKLHGRRFITWNSGL